MSVVNHNVIIATTWNADIAKSFRKWLEEHSPFPVLEHVSSWNGYHTFFIPPDGSNEGWETSNEYDVFRFRVRNRLKQDNYEDESSPWKFVEVGYGEFGQKVLFGNCINCYDDREYYS